jgi:hypothetical protein
MRILRSVSIVSAAIAAVFAASGAGSVAYYRIQGATLVIEFALQGSIDPIHTSYPMTTVRKSRGSRSGCNTSAPAAAEAGRDLFRGKPA